MAEPGTDKEPQPSETDAEPPAWRRALVAAAVAGIATALILFFGYERMRDDADEDAGADAFRGKPVKLALASDRAAASDSPRRAPRALFAARRSR